MEWYYVVGIIAYGVFVLQTAATVFGFDALFDTDFDTGGDFDISGGDIVSFKGFIHFAMGFSGWLMLAKSDSWVNLIIAVLVGVVFVYILYWVYRWCMKLSQENVAAEGTDLIGQKTRVTYRTNRFFTLESNTPLTVYDCYVGTMEVKCVSKSNKRLDIGSFHIIKDYADGYYVLD